MSEKEIKIKYFNKDLNLKLKKIEIGDWIDLRVDNISINYNKIEWNEINEIGYDRFDVVLIQTGVAIQLPKGYEAHVVPRSSTFKKFGLIQLNSVGVIDEAYCGDGDQWFIPMYCLESNMNIKRFDRVAQFRIVEKMPNIQFKEVNYLANSDRGGFGSTGYT